MARFFFAAYLAFWIGLVVGAYWLVSFVWPDPTTATCAGQGMGPYDRCSGLDYGGFPAARSYGIFVVFCLEP